MKKYLIVFDDINLIYRERFTYAKNVREALDNLYKEEYLAREGYTIDKVIRVELIEEESTKVSPN